MKISVIRSNRKTISIQVKPAEVIVRAPVNMKESEVAEFVDSKKIG